MLEIKKIKQYQGKSISQLIKIATKHFNLFIRERDKRLGCISCGGVIENAGHYLSAGNHSGLRFDEKNVFGQCIRCNKWLHGNLIEYRKGLIKRIGLDKVEWMEAIRHKSYKWDRFTLIEIILRYKDLNKK